MTKLSNVKFDDFTMKKVKVTDKGVNVIFEVKRVIDDEAQIIEHTITAKYQPHPDLTHYLTEMREFLFKAYGMNKGFDIALKYLKGEQKKKAEDAMSEQLRSITVMGISVSGEDQLRGAVISGKCTSFNEAKQAMNSPRIVFSSEKIGIEQDVETMCELLTKEVYKYIFEGKKAQAELFDNQKKEEPEPAGGLS